MGYNTKFEGTFRLDRPLDDETFDQLAAMDGPFDECDGYPSRWNQWIVGDDWQSIRWNGGEKFYGYIGWIRLLNGRFLAPRGYRLGGTVRFQGEDPGDSGRRHAGAGERKGTDLFSGAVKCDNPGRENPGKKYLLPKSRSYERISAPDNHGGQHVERIKEALGVSGVLTTVSSWSCPPSHGRPGAQVDLNDRRLTAIQRLIGAWRGARPA